MPDTNNYIHKTMAAGRWATIPFHLQMGNIGSEVSRSLKWYKKNPKTFQGAFERALELFDLSIRDAQEKRKPGKLLELCRAREEFVDYFNGNSFGTDPKMMQKYYDDFIGFGGEEN